jgi:hypothetical protein
MLGKFAEGEDLGRGKVIVASELGLILSVVNEFFEKLPQLNYYYGVEVNPLEWSNNSIAFERLLHAMTMKYRNIEIYETNARTIFPVRGDSGGLQNRWIFYLMQKHGETV